jgi:methyltransferase (TIGR00027 family)
VGFIKNVMTENLIGSVSDTAYWIAHYRAVETERPDALFRDPLAGVLAGDQGRKIARAMPMPLMTGWVVVIRTCIIDDYIRLALAEGIDGVVNLGAGLDTRPYRMNLPESLLWIEADYPKVIDFKEQRLLGQTPRCRLERAKVDLANVAERRQFLESIKARSRKTLVLTEGVISYLSVEEVGSLADDLKTLGCVHFWIADYFSPRVVKFRRRWSGMRKRMRNAPFRFTPNDWFAFFQEHGWFANEVRYLAEEGDRLGRPIHLPLLWKLLFKARTIFVSGERRAALRKFSAYVMLVPKCENISGGLRAKRWSSDN